MSLKSFNQRSSSNMLWIHTGNLTDTLFSAPISKSYFCDIYNRKNIIENMDHLITGGKTTQEEEMKRTQGHNSK